MYIVKVKIYTKGCRRLDHSPNPCLCTLKGRFLSMQNDWGSSSTSSISKNLLGPLRQKTVCGCFWVLAVGERRKTRRHKRGDEIPHHLSRLYRNWYFTAGSRKRFASRTSMPALAAAGDNKKVLSFAHLQILHTGPDDEPPASGLGGLRNNGR